MKKPRTRKDIAKAFLRFAASGKVREAYESCVGPGFRHHNAYFPGDAESPAGRDIAVVHIFRFKGTRIVEFWDVGMEAPQDSPNEHGLF